MADEYQEPTDAEFRKAAEEWLRREWTNNRTCPICGDSDWAVGDMARLLVEPLPGIDAQLDPRYPILPIGCRQCGYMVLINAMFAGLYRPPPERVHFPRRKGDGVEEPE